MSRARRSRSTNSGPRISARRPCADAATSRSGTRSEEHTSELQSRLHLVCRLLLEKKTPIDRQPSSAYAAFGSARFARGQSRGSSRARASFVALRHRSNSSSAGSDSDNGALSRRHLNAVSGLPTTRARFLSWAIRLPRHTHRSFQCPHLAQIPPRDFAHSVFAVHVPPSQGHPFFFF